MIPRLALAILILLSLIATQLLVPDLFPVLIAVVLVLATFVQWAAAVFFNRAASADPTIISLQARAQDAVSLAVASSVAGFLGLLVVLRVFNVIPAVDRAVFLVGLGFALVMIAAPAVNWLVVWTPWKRTP